MGALHQLHAHSIKWHSMATIFQLSPTVSSICSILVYLLPLTLFIAWSIILFAKKNEHSSKPPPPVAGGAWPIIGHLHLFGGKLLPHKLLGEMANKYGPVFLIRIGVKKALVVSSWEMAKECLLLNDKCVTSRPRLSVVYIMGYGDANFYINPYGPYWRSLRKIITLELLSNHRLDMLSYVWKEEANICINKLYAFWFKNKRSGSDAVLGDLKPWFSQMSMSIIVRIVSGKNCRGEEISLLHTTMGDFFSKIGMFLIGDALPFLRWLDLGGQEKAMRKTAKEMDDILQSWLWEHKERRKLGSGEGDKDFMNVMLSILDDSHIINNSGFDADTINKATCLMLLVGASDTSVVVLTWAISLLLNNRDILKKAQDELNIHVGKDRQVDESDIPKLVYLQAILKETLRMYPPGPLNGPREFNEDCTVGGYHVKKGTRLIINASKIHRDPRVWEDPMEFRPERFLTTHKDVDVRGQCFELIPFGSGRRICPGISFGIRNTHFLLASFLQAFEFSTLDNALVDMTESFGLTNLKATPLDVLIAPRLPDDLYE
uniref:Putative cytochrome P450 n=1 Tax=Fallopia multiflora TaxID=76025 RepID=A0A2D1PE19_9CARY|nr:putative cytochrome P450 [Fallopia multiflora]